MENDNLINELKEEKRKSISSSPSGGKILKKYAEIGKLTKNVRCQRVVRFMEELVGKEDLDLFVTDLVSFFDRNHEFQFRLKLTPEETFHVVLQFKLSASVMQGLKHFLSSKLSFDVFASRLSVDSIRKRYDPRSDYSIVATMLEKTVCGRLFRVPKTVVACLNVESVLRRRLESLDAFSNLVFDSGTKEDIVIAVTGDKGGEETKLCIIIENCSKPNSSHSLLLLGWYTGTDNHDSLKENFGIIFDSLNKLTSIEYCENGKIVKRKVRIKMVADCKFISSIYQHPGQSCSDPCFTCNIKICKSGKNRDTIGSFDFATSGEIRTLEQMRTHGWNPLLNIEPYDVEPPPLHIFMGLVKAYVVDPLFALCNKVDFKFGDLPESSKEQREYLKMLNAELDDYTRIHIGLQDTENLMLDVISVYEKMENNITPTTPFVFGCSSPHCCFNYLHSKHQNQDVFQCSECSQTFHTSCGNLFSMEECMNSTSAFTSCFDCKLNVTPTITERKDHVEDRLLYVRKRIESNSNLVITVMKEKEKLEEELFVGKGPTRQKLETVLVSIKCDPRVYYQQMTGNQVAKYVRRHV
ncbi:hypothetical protein CRE_11467 [Caenorhabditis remanei]|uniref:Zinc finger PHD-type domain-containing protein n=1 Tax=Caenorhabditis remanei TaxID=31234 RepID=E3NBG9_CAERE|nr:hypothetical protein CRE_11467 [Caenorhabditis remanei]